VIVFKKVLVFCTFIYYIVPFITRNSTIKQPETIMTTDPKILITASPDPYTLVVQQIPGQLSFPKYILIALNELGVQEVIGPQSNPRISEYLSTVKLEKDDEIPWCAAFVSWCLKQAGLEIPKPATGLARSFLNWGKEIPKFKLGCIAVLRRGQLGWQGHVCFPLDFNRSDNMLYCLGGNQSNRVSIEAYSISRLISFRVPIIQSS
jgi:uncharacterized protein (TIGR02594 family)